MKVIVLIVLLVAACVGVGTLGYSTGVYNQIIMLDQNVNEKWSQVQNVYQRRADLIPNIVETVKGYAKHERETLAAVAEARASATGVRLTADALKDPQALAKFQSAQAQLSGALSRLLVSLEQYPTLKADKNFLALQAQLEATENRIAVERQRFNQAVLDYNTRVRLVPGNVVASMVGFQPRPYFAADATAQAAPSVKFDR